MGTEIYFDNNATTRLLPEVVAAMSPFLTELYGNPSSIHRFGAQVSEKISEARAQVAGLIGASSPVVALKVTTRPSVEWWKRDPISAIS